MQLPVEQKEIVESILASDSVHYWVKDAIKTMLQKDPVDSVKNCILLLDIAKMLNQ